jgi:hypothetical protein
MVKVKAMVVLTDADYLDAEERAAACGMPLHKWMAEAIRAALRGQCAAVKVRPVCPENDAR